MFLPTDSPPFSAIAGHDKLIRIFDLDAPTAPPQTLPQASNPIRNLMFLQDDNVMVCALLDSPGIK